MAESNKAFRAKKSSKSPKPYDGFPLTAHPSGRWCKKFQGKVHYFGKLADWQSALARYEREWPFIIQGREVPPDFAEGGLRLANLADEFLNSKRTAVQSDELSLRSFRDYFTTCKRLIDYFGKDRRVDDLRPADFESFRASMADGFGVVTLKNEINRCRVVFKYASDNRLIDRPVHYGSSFAKPSAKLIRRSRNQAGLKMFEADELRRILDALASEPLVYAMTLLGVNCGFGNTDCANLPLSAVNLETGWIDYPRPKTEIQRRVPLWPETLDAIRKAIDVRPKPADIDDAECVFLTRQGRRWVRVTLDDDGKIVSMDPLAQRFARTLKKLGINGRRGFYAIRHTFETIGGESRDQVAVNAIMGHVDSSMAGTYRERISDERLQAVVAVVRAWLWPNEVRLPELGSKG